jgi:hypothetical protein
MRPDESSKFNEEKRVDFDNATPSWESRLLFAARLMFKPTSEAELRADCASAQRNDFVVLNATRGLTRDQAMEDAYA